MCVMLYTFIHDKDKDEKVKERGTKEGERKSEEKKEEVHEDSEAMNFILTTAVISAVSPARVHCGSGHRVAGSTLRDRSTPTIFTTLNIKIINFPFLL